MFDMYTFYPFYGTRYASKREKIHKESKINSMFLYKETATTKQHTTFKPYLIKTK